MISLSLCQLRHWLGITHHRKLNYINHAEAGGKNTAGRGTLDIKRFTFLSNTQGPFLEEGHGGSRCFLDS